MMLPLVVVGWDIKAARQSRGATTASGVDNAASSDWQTPLNGLFHLSGERPITMQTTEEPTQKYINEQQQIEFISMGNSCNYCEQYTRASSEA